MDLDTRKLAPNFVWLFALAALGIAILVKNVVPTPLTPKMWAGLFAVIYGLAGATSVLTTRTNALRAVGAFALAALGLGVFTYVSIIRYGGGGTLGTSLGVIFSVVHTVASFGGSMGGVMFGLKARKGMAGLIAGRPQGG